MRLGAAINYPHQFSQSDVLIADHYLFGLIQAIYQCEPLLALGIIDRRLLDIDFQLLLVFFHNLLKYAVADHHVQ